MLTTVDERLFYVWEDSWRLDGAAADDGFGLSLDRDFTAVSARGEEAQDTLSTLGRSQHSAVSEP